MEDRVFVPLKFSREQNRVAHCIANFGRSMDSSACWLNKYGCAKTFFLKDPAVAGIDFISREKAGNKFDQVIDGVK